MALFMKETFFFFKTDLYISAFYADIYVCHILLENLNVFLQTFSFLVFDFNIVI